VWSLADQVSNHSSEDLSVLQAVGCATLFFAGWILTRGANMQKHAFRTNPSNKRYVLDARMCT
jgi:hypothetical protein